jgi:hypothetical protein
MKTLFKKYPETLLVILAAVFLVVIVGYFAWGVGEVVRQLDRGVNAKVPPAESAGFNLSGARRLDLRGLVK